MPWSIPLTEPAIGPEEIDAVTNVLKRGWLTMGEVTAEFEHAFAAKMNVKHAIAVTNCTAALHLANLALGIQAGDEVICPALTFVATANATRYTGASVVFANISSQDDLTISPEDIERKISSRTKALAVVHYAGFPCRMLEIMQVAEQYGLKVIEDCAHAPFAWMPIDGQRRYVGTIGDIGCFSFFGNKNMTTGEGGMVTTNYDQIAETVRLLRSHGMTTMTYDRHRGHGGQYDVVALGYNYRIDELRSAIGLCQLRKIDRLNQSRREVFGWYREALAGIPGLRVPFSCRDLDHATCHIMPALVRRDYYERAKNALHGLGVQTSKHYQLIPDFSIYQPGSEMVLPAEDHDILTLPLGPRMSREQVSFVAQGLRSVLAVAA